jgi:23S rRNA pseudouridine2605 synthase
MERLQKVLAHAGLASRRAAETLITEGRVTVNGRVVTKLGTQVDPERDAIRVDGARVRSRPQEPLYLALHKPRGVVTTLSDPEGRPTVRDYLHGVKARVYPVGRLDYASEGLLLLTNDGALARDLMHPSRGVPKTYLAKVRGVPGPDALERLAAGIRLEGRRTLPARARVVEGGPNAWVEITVVEGRKHQVRNMLEAVGHPVQRLRRIRYGGVELGDLRPGRLRALHPAEVARLRRAASRPKPARSS